MLTRITLPRFTLNRFFQPVWVWFLRLTCLALPMGLGWLLAVFLMPALLLGFAACAGAVGFLAVLRCFDALNKWAWSEADE